MRVLVLFAFAALSGLAADESVLWDSAFSHGVEQARQQNKPILVEFWASWCGPCKRMDREVWSDPRVVGQARKYIAISVDYDKEKGSLDARFGVHSLPTFILLDPWQRELARRQGFTHPSDTAELLGSLPGDYATVRQFGDILDKDPHNITALTQMGSFYNKSRAYDLSNLYFHGALKVKEARENPDLCEALEIGICTNELMGGDSKAAKKGFELFLRAHPKSKYTPGAMFGLLNAELHLRHKAEAQNWLARLQSEFPESHEAQVGARLIAEEPEKK